MKTKIPNNILQNSSCLTYNQLTNSVDSVTGKLAASDTSVSTINKKIDDYIGSGDNGANVDISTIRVGSTKTLPPGSNATVTGTVSNDTITLNFGIPSGFDGENGITPKINVNSTTSVDSLSPAKVTNVGSSTDVLLNFEIPKGEKGEPGEHAISALNPRGDYSPDAVPNYNMNDYVIYNGSCFVCKQNNSENVPPNEGNENDNFWQLLALQGTRGLSGKNGVDGMSATISVGKTDIVAYNQPLKIINSGSPTNAIFDFQIPQSFSNFEIGTVESVSPEEEPSVIKRGTPDNVILDFKLNRGYKGADSGVGPSLNEYLLETEQVWGKWINGKTIYRYTFSNIPHNSNGPFSNGGIDCSFLNIEDVIYIEQIRSNSSKTYFGNRYITVQLVNNVLNSVLDYGLSSIGAGLWLQISLYYTRNDELI